MQTKHSHSMLIMDEDFESNKNAFSSQELANWVPQLSPQSPQITTLYHSNNGVFYAAKHTGKSDGMMMINPKWDDNCCIVPQISPPSFQRHRHFH